jgi:hypothetical protein
LLQFITLDWPTASPPSSIQHALDLSYTSEEAEEPGC